MSEPLQEPNREPDQDSPDIPTQNTHRPEQQVPTEINEDVLQIYIKTVKPVSAPVIAKDLIEQYPQEREDAQSEGFLRLKKGPEFYSKCSEEGFLNVIYAGSKPIGFINAIPLDYEELGAERAGFAIQIPVIGTPFFKQTGHPEISLKDLQDFSNLIFIDEIAIDKDFKRKGYGSILLRSVIEQNPDKGIITTCSKNPIPNKASSSFFQNSGFKSVGYFWLPWKPFPSNPFQEGTIWNFKSEVLYRAPTKAN